MVIRFSLFRDTGFARRQGIKGTHWFSKTARGHRDTLPTYRLVVNIYVWFRLVRLLLSEIVLVIVGFGFRRSRRARTGFVVSAGMGVYFIVQILGRGSNIPVWKRVDKLRLPRIGVP